MEYKRVYNDPVDENDIANKRYVDKSLKTDINYADIKNKPKLFSGSYNDLSDKPTIPDVNNLGSIVVDDISCKNLFNINSGSIETYNATPSISNNTLNLTCTGGWSLIKYKNIPVEIGKSYILSFNVSNPDENKVGVDVLKKDGSTLLGTVSITEKETTKQITFKATESEVIILLCANNTENANTNTVTFSNIQLEKGLVATEYTPYKSLGYTSGSNENGSWVKYDDGRMECTQIVSLVGLVINEAFGSCYFALKDVPNFPLQFKEPPVVSFGLSGGFTVMVGNGEETTINGVGKVVIVRPEAGTIPTSIPTNLYITAKGYWK